MRRFTFSSAKRTALTEELEEEDVSGQALRESVCMWLVQVIVHRGEGAGATASSCHDGEALGGLAHCQGQGGLLGQIVSLWREKGERGRTCQHVFSLLNRARRRKRTPFTADVGMDRVQRKDTQELLVHFVLDLLSKQIHF